MTDQSILEKLKSSQEQEKRDGLSDLIDKYASYVSAISCNLSQGRLSAEDVEEIASDVFLSVYRHGNSLKEGYVSLKPYLAKLTRNATISALRKQRGDLLSLEDDQISVMEKEGLDELTERREQKEIINESVESFGEPDREIFIRFYFFGESLKQISERVKINTATLKTKLHRCRKKIKSILEERGYKSA